MFSKCPNDGICILIPEHRRRYTEDFVSLLELRLQKTFFSASSATLCCKLI